jgi:O-antigen ligase
MGLLKHGFTYRAYAFLFQALALVLPIHGRLVPPVIALIGLIWLLELNFGEKYRRITSSLGNRYLLSFGVLYLLYVIGLLYSTEIWGPKGALFNLEVKLSLVLFPVFFTTIDFGRFGKTYVKKIYKAFILGCILSLFLIFNKAVFDYFQLQDPAVFYYVNLAFTHHPSYLSLYFSFAISILFIWLIRGRHSVPLKRNLVVVLILLFQVFILLLSSKAGILGLSLLYLLSFFYLIYYRQGWRKYIVPVLLLISFGITLSFFPVVYSRFYQAESALTSPPDSSSEESSVARMLVWRTSLQVIQKNPLIGVGTGDVDRTLMKLYKEQQIKLAIDETLNAHNQFIQTFMALGVAGFLVLVGSLVIPGWVAFRKKKFLYLLFLVVFSFHLLVESMLERQAGVVYYAFFNGLLFYRAFISGSESDL